MTAPVPPAWSAPRLGSPAAQLAWLPAPLPVVLPPSRANGSTSARASPVPRRPLAARLGPRARLAAGARLGLRPPCALVLLSPGGLPPCGSAGISALTSPEFISLLLIRFLVLEVDSCSDASWFSFMHVHGDGVRLLSWSWSTERRGFGLGKKIQNE